MPVNVAAPARPAPAVTGRVRRSTRALGALAVGLLAVTACTSDPGPKRVAQDIIEAEAFRNPDLDEECLLTELDKYTDDDLREIADDLNASNTERNEQGEAALLAYQRSLETCL